MSKPAEHGQVLKSPEFEGVLIQKRWMDADVRTNLCERGSEYINGIVRHIDGGWDYFGQLGNRRRTDYAPNPWPVNVIGTPGVVWRSSDPTKATFYYGQMATGRAIGNTTITATTAGFINDNAVLTVK